MIFPVNHLTGQKTGLGNQALGCYKLETKSNCKMYICFKSGLDAYIDFFVDSWPIWTSKASEVRTMLTWQMRPHMLYYLVCNTVSIMKGSPHGAAMNAVEPFCNYHASRHYQQGASHYGDW